MWKWIIALILLILFGIGIYTVHSLNQIEVTEYELHNLEFSMDSLKLTSTIYVDNPTWMELQLDEAPFTLWLNGNPVGEGTLAPRTLPPYEVSKFPVEQTIEWNVPLSLLEDLVVSDKIILTMNGTHDVQVYGWSFETPHHMEMDVKPQVEFFLRQQADQITALIPFELIEKGP